MEDVAEDYIEELIQRNMIQVGRRGSNGSLETCRIHDLLREFAISKGRKDRFLNILGNKGSAMRSMSRRLATHSTKEDNKEDKGAEIPYSTSLNSHRSILCFHYLSNVRLEDKSFYKSFKFLRVLDLRGAKWSLHSLPDEIGKLILLRYLNLHGTNIRRLPSSICNLRDLQTLDISYTRIGGIPRLVWKLKELTHFYANLNSFDDDVGNIGFSCNLLLGCKITDYYCHNGSGGAPPPPPQIGRLRNLQTLSARGDNWICSDDFSQLTNLRKLRIIIWNNMDHYGAALSNSIRKFIYLRELDIEWWDGCKLQFPNSLSQDVHLYKVRLWGVMEKLPTDPDAFPPNLAELVLYRTALKQEENDPMKTLSALKNLKLLVLNRNSLLGKQMVFPAMGFPNLICLKIGFLGDLEEWKVEEGSLSNLKVLHLKLLSSLKELPDGLRQVTTLQELNLWGVQEKIEDSVKRKEGDDWEKIKHIPIVRIID